MNGPSASRRFEKLKQAMARLEEAMAEPEDTPYIVDASIQRFEFAFELFWKTMKGFLELESSARMVNARDVLKQAYASGWIDDEQGWIDLLGMRNSTSHIYDETMARAVYTQIGARMPLLRKALAVLKSKAD